MFPLFLVFSSCSSFLSVVFLWTFFKEDKNFVYTLLFQETYKFRAGRNMGDCLILADTIKRKGGNKNK